ncbi:YdeI/OmpD-associated family protein [Pedobacter boryungensis]|uniref:YdeI/OmpD-associated family protein n=1 Tax=Pedobacter boryungensis TaxID=869962 RepID=A0ABX2DG55_9SPHI|nr:YdeI/OmpD-associated family protein [Pedobacter boryungensis]NQX33089.1 YdeI/OmpD-associated family protein [Pedobacter boryungensis]
MEQYDKRVDAYIEKSAAFAQPILTHLRNLVHQTSPLINETIKWGFPHFDYKGTVCSMAGFKSHCAFGFWKASLMKDPYQVFEKDAMGTTGRIEKIQDLPDPKILTEYILEALKLNEEGTKVKKTITPKAEIPMPAYFADELNKNPKAKQTFEDFSPSHRREYLEWVTSAKTEATKLKRLATTIEWLTEGKSLNWRYQR